MVFTDHTIDKLRKSSTSSAGNHTLDNEIIMADIQKKKKIIEDNEDIISIPDSMDNDLSNHSSRNAENTELVSTVLEGLESNIDEISMNTTEEKFSWFSGSEDQSCNQSQNEKSLAIIESKSCKKSRNLIDVGVQTSQNSGKGKRLVLQSVSVQCTASQTNISVQTDKVVSPTSPVISSQSSNCCQSNCCFRNFVETIPCNSLKTFIKSLMELKNTSSEAEETLTIATSSAPVVTETNLMIPKSIETKIEGQLESKELISSSDLIKDITSEDSIQSSFSSEVLMKTEVKEQNKPKAIRQSASDETNAKRPAPQLKNKKKNKFIESSDEEMEVIQTENPKPEEPVPKDVIQIDSSVSTTQSNGRSESSTSKTKPKIKGPKSRQKTNIETVCEKPKPKPKPKPKKLRNTYVSSDEEVEEVFETEDFKLNKILTEEKNKNQSNQKNAKNKKQNKKTIGISSVTESAAEDITLIEKQTEPRTQTGKRAAPKKLSVQQMAEKLAEKSVENTENVYLFTDDNKSEIQEPNKTKRKTLPKKRFSIEGSITDENDLEEMAKTSTKRLKTDETPKEMIKTTKYKPKPKSKQKLESKESHNDGFKRPPSPTPSVMSELSSSSSSSRLRASSTERPNHKRVILFSGLDEKQKKKIENVCRELDAEDVSEWSNRVTHLVIALTDGRPKKDMICPRNAKYIKALLHNIWIVSYDWIVDSSRSDRFVDESLYEIKADKTATERGLPQISRSSGKKLFSKCMVKFEGKFGGLLDDFKDFVEIGGGIVVHSEEEFDNKKEETDSEKLIVVTESVGLPNTQTDGTKYVSKKVFMDKISNFIEI